MDVIELRELRVRTILGVDPQERDTPRDVLIDLALHVDTRPAALSDRIEDAVDYRAVCERVVGLVERARCLLIERLAADVAQVCLTDPRVQRVRVCVDKPGALTAARSARVTIERDRGDP